MVERYKNITALNHLMKKTVLSVLLTALGLGVISYIIAQAGFTNIYDIFSKLNWEYFFYSLLAVAVWIAFRTLRWHNILTSALIKIKYRLLFFVTSAGLLIDFVTPIYRAGSEPVRTFMLEKYAGVSPGKGFATVILDRFFDLSIYITLAIISLLLIFPKMARDVQYMMIISVAFLVGVLVYLVYISLKKEAAYRLMKKIFRFLKRFKRLKPRLRKWEKKLKGEVEIYSATVREGFYLNTVLNLLISIILIGIEVVKMQLIFLALGLRIDFFWIIVVFGAVIIAGILPSPPGGVGIVEPVGIGAFIFAGLTLSQATAVVILDRIVMMGFVSLVGLIATYRLEIKKFRRADTFIYKPTGPVPKAKNLKSRRRK